MGDSYECCLKQGRRQRADGGRVACFEERPHLGGGHPPPHLQGGPALLSKEGPEAIDGRLVRDVPSRAAREGINHRGKNRYDVRGSSGREAVLVGRDVVFGPVALTNEAAPLTSKEVPRD